MDSKMALKVAGVVFFLMATAQVIRVALKVHVVAGSFNIPLRLSGVAAIVLVALGVWMFLAAKK